MLICKLYFRNWFAIRWSLSTYVTLAQISWEKFEGCLLLRFGLSNKMRINHFLVNSITMNKLYELHKYKHYYAFMITQVWNRDKVGLSIQCLDPFTYSSNFQCDKHFSWLVFRLCRGYSYRPAPEFMCRHFREFYNVNDTVWHNCNATISEFRDDEQSRLLLWIHKVWKPLTHI